MPQQILNALGTRAYYQLGPAGPTAPVYYAVPGELVLAGVTLPINGSVKFQKAKGDQLYEWVRVSAMREAPDEIKANATFSFKRGGIPRIYMNTGNINSFYVYSGQYGDLSRPNISWTDWVIILANGIVGDANAGDLVSMANSDLLKLEVPHTFDGFYIISSLNWSIQAATQITGEVADAVYGNDVSIGDGSPPNDGTQRLYAVSQVSAAVPVLTYTLNGGTTWTNLNIAVAASAEVPNTVEIQGEYAVVLSPTAQTSTNGGAYVSLLDSVLGTPGTFVKVTSGFVNNSAPLDMYVSSRILSYICGKAGYIYKMVNPLLGVTVQDAGNATTNDLNRIHGNEDTLVAVGAAGTVVKSTNRGQNWAAATAVGGSPTLSAVSVQGPLMYWVGSTAGNVYYTLDGGQSWTTLAFDQNGTGAINDIVFINSHVGYFVHTVGGASRIFWTIDGGQSWALPTQGNRHKAFPTSSFQRVNRLAYPRKGGGIISSNNLAAVGLGLSTDGQLAVGAPNAV